jgi:uncharacterized protein with HEPN domain
MRFQSERDQQLAIMVISQMIDLVDTLLQRMEAVQNEADLTGNDGGRLLLDAVCMQYLALGEAVKQLDKLTGFTLQEQVPEQDWKGIMGFRDVLAHQYFNIDPRQVLWITQEALPSLQVSLKTILATLISSGSASMIHQHETNC